jgi:hypothetical protein
VVVGALVVVTTLVVVVVGTEVDVVGAVVGVDVVVVVESRVEIVVVDRGWVLSVASGPQAVRSSEMVHTSAYVDDDLLTSQQCVVRRDPTRGIRTISHRPENP